MMGRTSTKCVPIFPFLCIWFIIIIAEVIVEYYFLHSTVDFVDSIISKINLCKLKMFLDF